MYQTVQSVLKRSKPKITLVSISASVLLLVQIKYALWFTFQSAVRMQATSRSTSSKCGSLSNIHTRMDIGCDNINYSNSCEARLNGVGQHLTGICGHPNSQLILTKPTTGPSAKPVRNPSRKPTPKPTSTPVGNPSPKPTPKPMSKPTLKPSLKPSLNPSQNQS